MNKLKMLLLILITSFMSTNTHACHALAVQDYNLTVTGAGVQVDASSTSPTCGCDEYWLDVEVRCIGEPFNAGPFDPTQYLSLSNYPYFQSATMLKPDCQVQAYPTVTVPFGGLCPGIDYQVRVRENNNGNGGPWSAALTFTVPGTIDPLVGQVTSGNVNLCLGDCTTLDASVTGGCDLAPLYSWSTGETTPSINVCPAATTTYSVDITEQCSNLTTTESITVYVVPTPVAGTAASNPTTVCIGETTNLTLVGFDGNIQWQSAPNAGGPWTNVGGAITDNETSPPINSDICFRVEVSGCGPSDISNVVCVTMSPTPILTVSSETICDGETTTLTSNVDLSGGTYIWTPTGQTTQDLTISPSVTTNYNLEYTLNGCDITETGIVTVNPQPTTLNLNGSTICDGDNVTITATPDELGGTYVWTPNISNNNTATVSPGVGTNTYTIDYDLNGCVYSESIDIIVNPVPTVDITEQEICNGENTTLTAVPDLAGGDFLWSGGEITDNINISPNTTTNYTITYTLNGCVANDNADVIVNPMPTADFNFTDVCEDLVTPLNSTSVVPAPGVIQTNEWDIGNDGSVEYTNANSNHNFGGWGTYDVNLTVTTDDGCTDNITQTVGVYPLAIVDFDATPLCLGNPTDFTDLTVVPNGGSINNWDWDFDDGNTDNTQNPSNTYTNSGNYNVTLEVTTDNGCVTNLTQSIEIYDLPIAGFDFVNDCFYNDIEFINTSSGNSTNFEWDFDDGNTDNTQNTSNLYDLSGTYDVTLSISTDDGCSDEITQTIIAYSQPNPGFNVDPNCLNDISNFTDGSTINPVDGDVITSWDWSFGDGNTDNIQNPSNTYTSSGNYNVTLVVESNFGCVDSITQPIEIYDLPFVDFEVDDNCFGIDSEFNSLTNNSSIWNFGDGGNTSTDQNPSNLYLNDGNYNVTLTQEDQNGCINDTTKEIIIFPKPIANFSGTDLSSCSPLCFNIESSSEDVDQFIWTFSNGDSYNGISISDCIENQTSNDIIISVTLEVVTENNCRDTMVQNNYLTIYKKPIANFNYTPNDNSDIVNSTVDFNNLSLNADYYTWSMSNTSDTYTSEDVDGHDFGDEPGDYEVELISYTDYCSDTINAVITLDDVLIFHIPNTFTPDNNGVNEVFKPIFTSGFDPFNYNLTIYNRWGEIVFESNNTEVGWDGTYDNKIVKDGTYVWVVRFKETMSDKIHERKGHVNVLR